MLIFILHPAGVTANSGEVWAADNGKTFPSENKGYLISKKQGLTEEVGDLTKQENAEAFFKNWEVQSYDSASTIVFAGKQHYQKR